MKLVLPPSVDWRGGRVLRIRICVARRLVLVHSYRSPELRSLVKASADYGDNRNPPKDVIAVKQELPFPERSH